MFFCFFVFLRKCSQCFLQFPSFFSGSRRKKAVPPKKTVNEKLCHHYDSYRIAGSLRENPCSSLSGSYQNACSQDISRYQRLKMRAGCTGMLRPALLRKRIRQLKRETSYGSYRTFFQTDGNVISIHCFSS